MPLTSAQSPAGRIFSDTGLSIFECNSDGSNCFTVAGNGDNDASLNPSVASDGTIAFNSVLGTDATYQIYNHIFLMNPDGTNARQVTFNPPSPPSRYNGDLNPAISPDASMVAFLASRTKAADGSQNDQIYLVNADGSNLRQLTPYIAASNGDYSSSAMYGFAWSPDSKRLAFRGSVYSSQCGTYGGQPIFVNVIGAINADGTGMQILACDAGDGYHGSIDWSPDGTLIAWGRNVNHGAQGCSGCVGEPAIGFLDMTGHNRYSAGITSTQLTTDSCGDPHCIHFSPGSDRLAYWDEYPNRGNPCSGGPCWISLINLDGSGQTNTTIHYAPSYGMWWTSGAVTAPARLTLSGTNQGVPPNPVEVWPGFSEQLIPTLSDNSGNVILHAAASYALDHYFYASDCLVVGPYGLAVYTSSGSGYGTITASNAGLTSNTLSFKCWGSAPCTFSLGSAGTDIPAGGDTGSFTVSTDPGSSGSSCPWDAKTSASWITITSNANGSGNGSVAFIVAANSGGTRQGTISVAGINYTVTQDPMASGPPVIQAIADVWDYTPGVAPGTWVTIVGTELATGPARTWDLTGQQKLPTTLGDVSVFFNGTAAALCYVSATQINALVPASVTPGAVQVTIQANGLNSAVFPITATATLPSIYALPNADGSTFFVTAALAGTATLVGNSSVDPRVVRAARAGDVLDLYMIGVGGTLDLTAFVTDRLFAGAFPVSASVTAMIGSEPAQVVFAGLTSPGLYLVRVLVPADLGAGPKPIQISTGAQQTRSSLVLMVQ